jgi:hypothetical protein
MCYTSPSVLDYNQNITDDDVKDQLLHSYNLERRRLEISQCLNPKHDDCRANSPGTKSGHLKFRVNLIQTPPVKHGSGDGKERARKIFHG